MRAQVFVLLLAGIGTGTSFAQTTRPTTAASAPARTVHTRATTITRPARVSVDAAWRQTVSDFADRLVSTEADVTTESPLAADVAIRPFGNSVAKVSWEQMRARAFGHGVIAMLSYRAAPKSLATDIALAVRDASIPDSVKSDLTPAEGEAAERANRVAAAWLGQTLAPAATDLVGVIVLYPKTDAGLLGEQLEAPGPRAPLFVLLKGTALPDGTAPVQQIVFGDPREASGR